MFLKKTFNEKFDINIKEEKLSALTECSRLLDEILNKKSSFIPGHIAAFSHKGGLHVSAVQKDPKTYEHIDPALVGNHRNIIISNQAGRSNILSRLESYGIKIGMKTQKFKKF